MNIKLLKQIQNQILSNPKDFIMGNWTCGTAACIGGWAVCITNHKQPLEVQNGPDVGRDAAKLLELTDEQEIKLFYPEEWPQQFSNRWQQLQCERRRRMDLKKDYLLLLAQVAVDRIQHLIDTGK